MSIESDARDCECRHRSLILFQGWRSSWWDDRSKYQYMFLGGKTFWNKVLFIVIWVIACVIMESFLVWPIFNAASLKNDTVAWLSLGFLGLSALPLALLLSAMCMACIDIACHFFIGRTRYLFLDQHGQLHVHRRNPEREWLTPFSSQHGSWDGFLSQHRIFQVRSGGFWRRSRVIANGRASWKLSVGLFGNRLILTDPDGSSLAVGNKPPPGFVNSGDRLKETLRLAAEYSRVNDVIVELEEQKRSVAAFNALGTKCAELIRLMETSKQTMGRSKHAQLLRERLEAVFQTMPEGRVKNWTQAAEKADCPDS